MNPSNELGDLTAASHPSNEDGDFMIVVIAFLVAIVVVLSLGLLVLSTTGTWLVPG
ncbi:MAG TPA: hypothetical protein VFE22_00085 [Edaphobacter sp.]|jgi:hypothetical protein|nr:hypothetical protein [Edaphobacter sp.]